MPVESVAAVGNHRVGARPASEATVVGDVYLHFVGEVAKLHGGNDRWACVFQGVRQRLLHDAVDGQGKAGAERDRCSLDGQCDRQPGGLGPGNQRIKLVDARLRCQFLLGVGRAKHAEQPVHLGQRGRPVSATVAMARRAWSGELSMT